MENYPELPDLGELEDVAFKPPAESGLRVGEGVVAVVASETGIAGFFPVFDSAEEGLKSQVKPFYHILENLRIDGLQGRSFNLKLR